MKQIAGILILGLTVTGVVAYYDMYGPEVGYFISLIVAWPISIKLYEMQHG